MRWWICGSLWIFTIGLTSSGCHPHTSSVWPWSGAPKVPSYGTKVPLYGTYLDGLQQYSAIPFDSIDHTLINWLIIITLPLRLNASGQRGKIIIQTNDTSFWRCSISLFLSLPRKLIGLLDPSSPVRLMAATWSLPDCGWWRQWDCFWFCFMLA